VQPPQPVASPAVAALVMPASPSLLWRSLRTAASPVTPPPAQSAHHAVTADSVRSTLQTQPAASSPIPTARAAVESGRAVLPLSGPAIDHLAEDVMRRIERRIRIERERRGL
jgi:hypothetical protein